MLSLRLPPRYHAPLPPSGLPGDLAPAIADALGQVNARLHRACATQAPARLAMARADGGWSVYQVLEHVALTNEAYITSISALSDRLAPAPHAGTRWRPTLAGRWLVRSLEMRLPLPAPRRVQPGPAPRPDVLAAAIETHVRLAAAVQRFAATDWRAARMRSPLSTLVHLNFGDAVLVVLRHSERHTAQIERLIQALA